MRVQGQFISSSNLEKYSEQFQLNYKVKKLDLELQEYSHKWYKVANIENEEVMENGDDLPMIHKGYFDSHLHATALGAFKDQLNLFDCKSKEDFLKRINDHKYNDQDYRGFIEGYGWKENQIELELCELNSFFASLNNDYPLFLTRICGHSAGMNKAMARKFNWPEDKLFITDRELVQFHRIIPLEPVDYCCEKILQAQDELLSEGITAISDMSLHQNMINALELLVEENKLLIDVIGVFDAGRAPIFEKSGRPFFKKTKEISPFLGREARLSIRHWKKYLDGSFGSETAWLKDEYLSNATHGDQLEKDDDKLWSECLIALDKGFSLSFHTIGDAALDQALRMGQRILERDNSALNLESRHRLEHVQLVRQEQIDLITQQNIWTLFVQPHHRVGDDDFIFEKIGEQRVNEQAYRLASLLEQNIPVSLSSDAPIDSLSISKHLKANMNHPNKKEILPSLQFWGLGCLDSKKIIDQEAFRLSNNIQIGDLIYIS